MRLTLGAFALGIIGLSAGIIGTVTADEKVDKAEKKPAVAKQVPGTCRMYVCWDKRYDPKDELNRTGKLHDPVGEHGLAPVLAVFSRTTPTKADVPVMQIMQEQDRLAAKFKALRMGTFTAFLGLTKDFPDDGERDMRIAEVTAVGRQGNPTQVTVGLCESTVEENAKVAPSPQVVDWKIGEEDDLTVVFYYRFEVLGRWSFTKDKPPTAADIDAIATEVEKVLGPRIAVPKKK